MDIFYYTESNELVTEDVAKFVVPLLTGFLAFLAWIMAIAGASVACCCASIVIQEVRTSSNEFTIDCLFTV